MATISLDDPRKSKPPSTNQSRGVIFLRHFDLDSEDTADTRRDNSMAGQDMTYYYVDNKARTVFYSDVELEGKPNLEFLGFSNNPKKRMAAAVMLQNKGVNFGMTIKPWTES
jgi:hypothetical protein